MSLGVVMAVVGLLCIINYGLIHDSGIKSSGNIKISFEVTNWFRGECHLSIFHDVGQGGFSLDCGELGGKSFN